jgi:hypothetical protein
MVVKKVKLKTRDFCSFRRNLSQGLFDESDFLLWGGNFLIEVDLSSCSIQLKYIFPAGSLLESSPNTVVKKRN